MTGHPYLTQPALQYKRLTIILLVTVLFISLAQFASFSLIQNHVISYYGAQPEDVSMGILAMYAGIVTFLPVQFRLMRYFTMRKYLIVSLCAGILINIGSFLTHDMVLFIFFRFLQGIISAICGGGMLIVIFSTQPEEKKIIIGSSIFFGAILCTSVVIGVLSSWIAVNMDWNLIYCTLIIMQVIALLICLSIFRSEMNQRPYPLYQMDIPGTIFFAIFSSSLAYVMIYGPKRYWFADVSIRNVAILGGIMLTLFLYRQSLLRRPQVDLRVFKYGKFIFGLFLLLLFYGIKDTINLIYGYAGGILGWDATDIVHLGLINITGILLAIWFSAKMIVKNRLNIPKLMLAGFCMMIFYNLWMYWSLTPNLSFLDMAIPVFLQGIASGLIFLAVMVFTTSSVPPFTGMTGIIICAYARFISTLNSISGFYTLQLVYNQEYKEGFLRHLTVEDPNFMERSTQFKNMFIASGYTPEQSNALSTIFISKAVGIQGQLLTDRVIFLIGALLMGIALMAMVGFVIINKIVAYKKQKHESIIL